MDGCYHGYFNEKKCNDHKRIMPHFAHLSAKYLNLAGYIGAIFDSFIFVTVNFN